MLNKDYSEMLYILEEYNVRYMIVGAYALAAYGYPRSTGDIDIWIDSSDANSSKMYNVLRKFGAPLHNIDEKTFTEEGIVFQIGVAPRRIDIITKISGDIYFDDAYDRCEKVMIDNMTVPILSVDDLIVNKSSTGRAKDREDVAFLNRMKK